MVIENLESAGVHQAAKDDRITFTNLEGWPGEYIAAYGHFMEGENEKRAAIFIGPEFGTVTRADLTAAAREALDARFDALIACGFNFDAHTSELTKLGPLPILKAKMKPRPAYVRGTEKHRCRQPVRRFRRTGHRMGFRR